MAERKKTNIIVILSDDQGSWSLGSYGNPEIQTPVLDQMAKEGIRFEHFFCTSPVCSPARASILTGKMPSQHGVLDWLGGGSVRKEDFHGFSIDYEHAIPYLADPESSKSRQKDGKIGFEETLSYQKYMNFERGPVSYMKDHLCYTEVLEEAGYTCGLAGKWHLGNSYEAQKGFSFWEVIARGGTNYMLPEYIRDGKAVIEERYLTDTITDDALRFLEENHEKPFYLSVHYTAPHDPWLKEDQPEDIWKLYDGCDFSYIPDLPRHPWQEAMRTQPKNEEERREYIQGYYTCVTAMDRNIGRIMEYLKTHGLAENTLVIFLADNGFNIGHHGIWGKGNATFPLNMYESSVKVPCIIWGTGVKPGQVNRALLSQYDLFPTILDVAGAVTPEVQSYMDTLPGTSMKQILSGKKDRIRDEVVVYEEYGPVRMIRDDRYKLIYRMPYGPHELYDLEQDPEEMVNHFSDPQYREIKIRLFQSLEQWFESYTDERYDGRKYPVRGDGQMDSLEKYGTKETVFKSF